MEQIVNLCLKLIIRLKEILKESVIGILDYSKQKQATHLYLHNKDM